MNLFFSELPVRAVFLRTIIAVVSLSDKGFNNQVKIGILIRIPV